MCLKWTHDINDATHIKSYSLAYREVSGGSWNTFNTTGRKKSTTIQGLKPNTGGGGALSHWGLLVHHPRK